MFTGSVWEENVCSSEDHARVMRPSNPSSFYLTCKCSKTGVLRLLFFMLC